MRSARLALMAVLFVLAAGACTSASAGWTYTPAPLATPVPSTSASAAPSGSPGASAPAGSPGASAAPSGSAAAGGAVVTIVASGIKFTTPNVTVPANTAFTLEFDNQDAATPHDVQIKDVAGAQVFKTDIFPGVAKRSFQVPALAAGSYPFVCTVHTTMTGTVTAQ